MAVCKTQYGIDLVCGDLIFPSGADKSFYVGYLSELSAQFALTQAAAISTISFAAYGGLRKFSGVKFSHIYASELQKAAGGNIMYLHRATLKLIALSVQDDVEIQRLTQSTDAFIVYKNNNDQRFILAPLNGLSAVAGPLSTTGQNPGDDVSDTVILEGLEKTKPLRFSGTDALLDSYVI